MAPIDLTVRFGKLNTLRQASFLLNRLQTLSQNLKVTEIKDTTVKFSWVVNLESDEWKNITIYVFPDENTKTEPISKCYVTERNAEQTCTAESLFSNTKYSGLGVVFVKNQGQPSATINFQTTPQTPHNLKVSSRTDTSISVSWEIPENEVTTSPIRYIVKATGTGQECASEESKSCKIKSLTPNTAYDLTIEACSVDNLSLCSEKSGIVKGFTIPAVKGVDLNTNADEYQMCWSNA
ncbi:hypothetical protein ACTXT7_013514 [Hymenolepis weldensis]